MSNTERNHRRILVIDDNRAVHEDLRKILGPSELHNQSMAETEAALFGDAAPVSAREVFAIDSAFQGREGLDLVRGALAADRPYAMAFVDVRMPPGWDGIETTSQLWKCDPDLQVVICTAYSDYSFDEMLGKLGKSDRLVILKKPFDNVEALQLANALTEKWRLTREHRVRTSDLEAIVEQRTNELRRSEEQFRLITEKSADLISVLNPSCQFLYASPSYQRILEYPLEALQSGSALDLVHPDHLEGVKRALHEALESDRAQTIEYLIRHRDGSWRLVESHVTPFRETRGLAEGVLMVARDITERQQAEARLRRSESSLRLAQQVGHIGSWEVDLISNQLEWSAETYRIFGLDPAGFHPTQEAFFACVHPEDRDRVKRTSQEALHQVKPYRAEHRILRPDGTERIVLEQAELMHDDTGRPVRIIGTVQDITEIKNLEARFRQAQKMEAIGQLAGGVAHDFNNALEVIRLHADLVLMKANQLHPEVAEGLKQIAAASDHAASLTRQLLAFSRKQVMQAKSLSLNDVIGNLTKMLNRIIGEDIQLQCTYATHLPYVFADPGMIEQVLINLAVNARDAMPQGGRLLIATDRITLDAPSAELQPDARPGEFASFTVTDTGTGIAPEHLPHLFEPFFTTKPVGKGTGLGLATVYGIVQQHHGWVEVSSTIGSGTTFKIFFPAVEPPQEKKFASAEGVVASGSETIFLVEDDQAVRDITRRILEKHGYTVHTAVSGPNALELWARYADQIDLLLTDVIMPDGMSGRDLVDRLRATQPELKVIFVSGYGTEAMGTDGDFLRQNKCFFLQKPSSSQTLCRTIRDCLDGKTWA